MKTYRVWATVKQRLYLDVEAKDAEEALEMAHQTDESEFTGDWASWRLSNPIRLTSRPGGKDE